MNALFFLLTLVMSLISGCASEPEYVPRYPGSRLRNSQQETFVIDLPKATVRVASYDAFDDISEVAAFYEGQLAGRPGWKGGWRKGDELGGWRDGNVQQTEQDKWAPRDPGKPGGYVLISKGANGCNIMIVSSTPK